MRWFLLVLLLLPWVADASGGDTVIVDRIVAVVGTTPIAVSQVKLEEEIGQRIVGDDCEQSFGRLLCDEREPLERLIFREILRQGGVAKGVSVSLGVVDEAERAWVGTFRTRTGSTDFLRRWGLDVVAFRETLLDVARLDQAIDVAVGRLVRDVSEEEERRYHTENIDTIFGGRPYEEVATMVSRQFYAFKFERTYGSWSSELRAAGRVRYVGR